MTESFPLQPDPTWYGTMRDRYGDAVPEIEHLQIRRGLQDTVDDMLEKLRDADRFRACRIHGITTRTAGFVVVDARFAEGATEADKRMCGRILERIQERLCEACEHCGRPGEIFAKTGLKTRPGDPDAVLGDRFLCTECRNDWSGRND